MERKVVMTLEDFGLIKEYIRSKPLPFKETEVVINALNRAMVMDITINEPKEEVKKPIIKK